MPRRFEFVFLSAVMLIGLVSITGCDPGPGDPGDPNAPAEALDDDPSQNMGGLRSKPAAKP